MAFELSPSSGGSWTESFLYEFTTGADGYNPLGSLIFDKAGNLYGTTDYGGTSCDCGTVFKLSPGGGGSWAETVLYSFQGNSDGSFPNGNLVPDQAGNLYGTTNAGGGLGGNCFDYCGTVFELSPVGQSVWQESVLWSFTGRNDGAYPSSPLMMDASGALLGETDAGGPNQNGVVYKLSPSAGGAWQQSTIATFRNGTDGEIPSGLTLDRAGNLYGATDGGGLHGLGTAFELSPVTGGGWKETILYNFDIQQGRGNGISTLVFDTAGNLYGTTSSGGGHGAGEVFELSPGSGGAWTKKDLYIFTGGADGRSPSGLVVDTAGNLYGTTMIGGSASKGVVFKLTATTTGFWTETVLHNFTGYPTDGGRPIGGVVFDLSGNLYGTTTEGGSVGCLRAPACGTIYQLTLGSSGQWTETVLHNFVGGNTDGGDPISPPIIDQNGNLFGVTQTGGSTNGCGCGIAYELSPSSDGWKFTILHLFPAYTDDGYSPSGSLLFDQAGNLYGTTSSGGIPGSCGGGAYSCGTVFKLSPATGGGWTEGLLHSFGAYKGDGGVPSGLVMDSQGNLFGVAYGGLFGSGVVFEVTP